MTILALLVHVGYIVFGYLTFCFDPVVSQLTVLPILIFACLHAITGMCSVFLLGDGTCVGPYHKQNRKTVIQRVTAALILPLLILHMKTFGLLEASSKEGQWEFFALLLVAQVAFYVVIGLHVACSFSRALITLGLISRIETQEKIDRVVMVVCMALVLVAAFVVVMADFAMFVHA